MTESSPAKSGPKEVFLHLLSIITLYLSAVAFGTLLFQYINAAFPDATGIVSGASMGAVRFALASLVIVFPAYLWTLRVLTRDARESSERRNLRIRRWLIAFTIFAAAVVMIGDLVAVIYAFLGGDLTLRFFGKVLAILLISGAIFFYYLRSLRERDPGEDAWFRAFSWVMVAIVAVGVVGGFFTIGSPFQERLRRIDERRVGDLSTLQYQILNYWQAKDSLPQSLDNLRDSFSGFEPPQDPETKIPYEYRATGPLTFELCATFAGDASAASSGRFESYPSLGGIFDNWQHAKGRHCFERTIDPDIYGTNPKKPLPVNL